MNRALSLGYYVTITLDIHGNYAVIIGGHGLVRIGSASSLSMLELVIIDKTSEMEVERAARK